MLAAAMSLRGSSECKIDIGTTTDDILRTGSSEHKTGSFGIMKRNLRRGGSLSAAMMLARESNENTKLEQNNAQGSFGMWERDNENKNKSDGMPSVNKSQHPPKQASRRHSCPSANISSPRITPAPLKTFARRRRSSTRFRVPEKKLKSLVKFVTSQQAEKVKLLEAAMITFEKRTKSQNDSLCDFMQSILQKSASPFDRLARETVFELMVTCTVVDVGVSNFVYRAGDEVDAFYLPIAGLVDVYMEGVGQVATIKRGRAFGLTGIRDASKCTRKYSVKARESCHLLSISKLAYHSLKTLNDKLHDERLKSQLTFLHSVPVLSKLERSEVQEFMPLFKRCEFNKGEDIVLQQVVVPMDGSLREPASWIQQRDAAKSKRYIYFLHQGECVVMMNTKKARHFNKIELGPINTTSVATQETDKNLHRVSKLPEKQCFGDISVLLDRAEPATIRVSSLKAVLWRIHKDDVPKLGESVVKMMKKNAIAKLKWRNQEINRVQGTNRVHKKNNSKSQRSKHPQNETKNQEPQRGSMKIAFMPYPPAREISSPNRFVALKTPRKAVKVKLQTPQKTGNPHDNRGSRIHVLSAKRYEQRVKRAIRCRNSVSSTSNRVGEGFQSTRYFLPNNAWITKIR